MSLAIVLALASLAVAQPQIDASGPPAARFAAAADAYLAGDFATAERLWDALLSEGYTSASLHLNLGNARLRAGRRGTAIASYVRALRLDPGDPDAHHNLELARAANVDRLVGGTGPSLLDRVASRTSNLAAALAFAVPWWLLWVCLSGRLVSGRRARAWLGAGAALATLGAILGGSVLLARDAEQRETTAIVVAPSTGVREGPEEALRATTMLHEGTELRVLEARGPSVRVKLVNGLEGWVSARDLEAI
ncbi:MAG: tetratricopeptide repeat protein [Anaeromyxobacter sp.]